VREIDIHGLLVTQAKTLLDHTLNTLPKGVFELRVIHGYRGGNVLQQYVRKSYRHRRIERVLLTMNSGETILRLKDKS
jgi:hypothetical protein